ncbi:MAG: hypothetical protein ACTSQO_06955 [Candidatus Helarchaeota archaeon]
MNEELEFTTIDTLNPRSRNINIKVKVISKGDERTVMSRKDNSDHRVCNVLVGDDTAVMNLVLWDNKIDEIEEDKTYEITNSYVTIFNNSMQISLGRYGNIQETELDITPNTENNVSDKVVERQRYSRSGGYSRGGSSYSRGGGRSYNRNKRRY